MSSHPPVPPQIVGDIAFAFAQTQVLLSAAELDVFQTIQGGASTAAEVAAALGADPRGVRILLNALVGLGLLAKEGDRYALSPASATYLVPGEYSMGDLVERIRHALNTWAHLTEVVRTGRPPVAVDTEGDGAAFFRKLVRRIFPGSFAAASAAAEALGVGRTWTGLSILDVAAGSGAWGIAFARRDPEAHVTAFDWPAVLEITREYVGRYGLLDRYTFQPGDVRDADFGVERFDLVLLGHICHSAGPEATRRLLREAGRALKARGKVLIAEMVPNDDRTGPLFPLLFAVNMLVQTTEGDTFTMAEYRTWLAEAGFGQPYTIEAPAPSPLIVADVNR